MNVFLDTSSLVKLYHNEKDSEYIENSLKNVSAIYLSEIARLEFVSALWKKGRMGEIDSQTINKVVNYFENDIPLYNWIKIDHKLVNEAAILLKKHGLTGLRTLDAIQLASAKSAAETDCLIYSSDKLLNTIFKIENFKVFEH